MLQDNAGASTLTAKLEGKHKKRPRAASRSDVLDDLPASFDHGKKEVVAAERMC